MKFILAALFLWSIEFGAQAIAPPGSPLNKIELAQGGYVVLQVTDSASEGRKFFVSCEMNLPEEKSNAMKLSGVSVVALKAKEFQSLVNYWLTPAVDNYITCATVPPSKKPSEAAATDKLKSNKVQSDKKK